jgi:hypothetical protein
VLRSQSKSTSSSSNNRKTEVRLLIQAGIIVTSFLVENFAFLFLFGKGPLATATITVLAIINSSINPFVYLIFNSTLRKQAIKMCFGR